MLRLDRVVKPWKESGALNAHINLYSFWNDEVFLTKVAIWGLFCASVVSITKA